MLTNTNFSIPDSRPRIENPDHRIGVNFLTSVTDRIGFNAEPDTDRAFLSMRIRIGSGSRSRVLMTKSGKNIQPNFFFFKNCNLLIPKLPSRTSKLQEKSSSLIRENLGLQNLIFFTFLDPDPAVQNECGSVRIRICNTDFNPKMYELGCSSRISDHGFLPI
jgi:hypothetical protein